MADERKPLREAATAADWSNICKLMGLVLEVQDADPGAQGESEWRARMLEHTMTMRKEMTDAGIAVLSVISASIQDLTGLLAFEALQRRMYGGGR